MNLRRLTSRVLIRMGYGFVLLGLLLITLMIALLCIGLFQVRLSDPALHKSVLVLFMATGTCAIMSFAAFWTGRVLQARERRRGHCPRCGYDLRGRPSAEHCSECGFTVRDSVR